MPAAWPVLSIPRMRLAIANAIRVDLTFAVAGLLTAPPLAVAGLLTAPPEFDLPVDALAAVADDVRQIKPVDGMNRKCGRLA